MQQCYGIVVHRVSQAVADGGDIEHRVASGQHARAPSAELPDEVPQRPPGAGVAPTVGEFVEAVYGHLDGAASDQWFQFLLDETGPQARQRARDAVAQRREHLAAAFDVKKQGRARRVRGGRRPAPHDALDEVALADAGGAVEHEDAESGLRGLQSVADVVERQFGRAAAALDPARVRQEFFRLAGLLFGEVPRHVHLRTGQAAEIGERLAHQQALEIAIPPLSRTAQDADGAVRFTPDDDFFALAHELRRPPAAIRRLPEDFEWIREQLQILEFLAQDVVHGSTLPYEETRSVACAMNRLPAPGRLNMPILAPAASAANTPGSMSSSSDTTT